MSGTQAKAEDPEFLVEVIDDTPEEDRDKRVAPDETENDDDLLVPGDEISSYRRKVQKRISGLSEKAQAERRAKEVAVREREAAASYAEQVAAENAKLREYAAAADRQAHEQAKQRAQAQLGKAKRDAKDAYEAGDPEKIVDAQSQLAQMVAEDHRIANYRPPPAPQEQRRDPPKPVEIPKPDARAEKWAEDNEWFGSNKRMTAFAYGIHEELVAEGIDPTSAAYYKRIDSEMRSTFPKAFQAEEEPVRVNRTPVVAPATRSVKTPRTVQLTVSQVALARRLSLTNEQYAAQIIKDQQADG